MVECDGHAFHEKTKEQAKRDKKRDRFFQEKNIIILHYTGSEIWNNVFECAEQAISTLIEITTKEADALSVASSKYLSNDPKY